MTGVAEDDRGFTLGVGLFETVLVERGRPVLLQAHLDRLARGCARLGLPLPDPDAVRTAAAGAVAAAGLAYTRAALRLTWSGGPGARGLDPPGEPAPRLFARASPAAASPLALALATSTVRRNPSSPTSRCKTLSSLDAVLARAEARRVGADEALMLNTTGELACAAAGNLFWLSDGVLHTPALACGVLDGVVRAEAIRLAPAFGLEVREVAAPPERLVEAEAAFVTNSLIGAVRAVSLDSRPLSASPAADALLAALTPAALAARDAQAETGP